MNPTSLKEGTSLAEDVYKFASSLASKNNVDAGELLLQAVWHCMNKRQKGTDQLSKDIHVKASTTNDVNESNKSTKSNGSDSACEPEDDKQNSYRLSQSIDNQSTVVTSQNASTPESPVVQNRDGKKIEKSTTEVSTSDKNTVTTRDTNCVEDVIDLIDLGEEKNSNKNLPSTGNELGQDYFDMDCEEIVETVDDDKDNTYQITKNVDKSVSDTQDFFVIEDDEEEEGGGETNADVGQDIPETKPDISKLPPQPGENKEEKDTKGSDVDENVNEEIANETSQQTENLSNVEIIDLDSDDDSEKEEKRKEADNPQNGSHYTESVDNDVKPVSIVRLFTNKSQGDHSDRADLSKPNICDQSDPSKAGKDFSQCNVTEFCDDYSDDMVDYEDRDMLRNVAAVGLTPRKQHFPAQVSSVEYDDRTPQKRTYTEMTSEETVISQQASNTDEGCSSPRIKKRLLDFDKKWHQAPKYSPQQDMYLARPGGIESNVHSDVKTENLMPSIQNIEGSEFRKPGFYTSVSICSPNVVIESVDSNRPVNYNWAGAHHNTYYSDEDKFSDTEYDDSDYMSDSRETHTVPEDPSKQSKHSVTGNQRSTFRGARNIRKSRIAAGRGRVTGVSTWRSSSRARGSSRGRVTSEGRGSGRGRGSGLQRGSIRGRSSGLLRGSGPGRGSRVLRGSGLLRGSSRGRWSGRGRGSGQGRGSGLQRASSRGRSSGLLRGSGRGRWASQRRGRVNSDSVIRGQAAVRVRRGRGRVIGSRGSTRGRISSNLSAKLVRDSLARSVRGSVRARRSARSRRGTTRGRGRGRGFGSASSACSEDKEQDVAKSDQLPTRGKSQKVHGTSTNRGFGSSASDPLEIQDSDTESVTTSSRGRTRQVTGTYRHHGAIYLGNSMKTKAETSSKATNMKIVSKKLAVTAKRGAVHNSQPVRMSSIKVPYITKKTDRQLSPQNVSKAFGNVIESKRGGSKLLKRGRGRPRKKNPTESLTSYVKATVQAIENQLAKGDDESNSEDLPTVIVID